MTHTLHPEIEALEIELLRKFNKDPQDDRTIREILEKYLKMPQPIENEPNYDAACMYVVANGLAINKDDVKGILKAASGKEEQKQSTPQIEKIDQQFAEKIVDWLINKYNLRYEPF